MVGDERLVFGEYRRMWSDIHNVQVVEIVSSCFHNFGWEREHLRVYMCLLVHSTINVQFECLLP